MILNNKYLRPVVEIIRKYRIEIKLLITTNNALKQANNMNERVFYIGIPAYNNLGDLAQGMCIRMWLKKHYPKKNVIEIQTDALVNTHFSLLGKLKKVYRPDDVIIFQSGYTTTDLGGYADEMHRAVMGILPEAKILMMPQTIFFRNMDNKKQTSIIYNSMRKMLFLARDKVSYDMALTMFPDIQVRIFPDIVTTLIGNRTYEYIRDGILFCCRNDGEKYYSDDEMTDLMRRCSLIENVAKTDTTKDGKLDDIVNKAEYLVEKEIDRYAHYKLVITDRYHGTIFSLVAGTPVIILKTTDHKVITGSNWFKGVYDDYVHVAIDIDDAFRLTKEVIGKPLNHKLEPFFEREYYDELLELFEQLI